MKLEIKNISGEQVPTVIADCTQCGGAISVRERDFLFSRPLHCNACNHVRTLSYREYVLACNSLAPQLLEYSISRMAKRRGIRSHRL